MGGVGKVNFNISCINPDLADESFISRDYTSFEVTSDKVPSILSRSLLLKK